MNDYEKRQINSFTFPHVVQDSVNPYYFQMLQDRCQHIPRFKVLDSVEFSVHACAFAIALDLPSQEFWNEHYLN